MSDLVVGLTGGIGSGKTAVSDRFEALGIKVVDADIAARVVVEPGQPALEEIEAYFGAEMINADGTLDRAALRKRVFADETERRKLESITHPHINRHIAAELARAESPYAILAHPILIETGQTAVCDRVLVVDVPEQLQIERTMARDDNPESQVRAIMAAQASREERLAAADDVIVNDRDVTHLDSEVARLHAFYLELAAQKSGTAS